MLWYRVVYVLRNGQLFLIFYKSVNGLAGALGKMLFPITLTTKRKRKGTEGYMICLIFKGHLDFIILKT